LCKHLYAILFLSVPLFQLDLYKEKNYIINITLQSIFSSFNLGANKKGNKTKKPLFYSIFAYFGAYETGLNKSRFVLDLIYLVLLLLYMLFRIFFGGFKKPIFNTIAFIISIIFIVQNSIFTLTTFLSVLFNGFSIPSYYDGFYFMKDDIIQMKVIAYVFFIIPIFAINLSLLINSFKFCFHFKVIRKDLLALLENNQENQEENNSRKIEEFKYINLKGNICILKEYKNENLRRYLCFTKPIPEVNYEENQNSEYNDLNFIIHNNSIHLKNKPNENTIEGNRIDNN